jgi:hypothetical protein
VDRVVFFAGIASSVGGVFLFLYQGLTYLMHNEWTAYSLYFLVEHGPESLQAKIDASPGILNALQGCPLFVALIVAGLLLLFIGSRLTDRYLS